MKKILVPTDFSPVADNALDYAIDLAAEFGSELLLYHVYFFYRKEDYDWDLPEDEQPFVKKIEKQMTVTKERFMEKINQKGVVIQTGIAETNIYSLFTKIVEKHKISLIIMGSKGASGLEKVILGSVAATALDVASVPLLVIPPNRSFLHLKKIVMTTDLNEVDTNIFSPLQHLIVKFDAKVTMLNVNPELSEATIQKNHFPIQDLETTYVEIPMSNNINKTINDFVRKHRFDLMCMIRREKGIFESIFKRSITLNQVYDNIIPLLVLPENSSTVQGSH